MSLRQLIKDKKKTQQQIADKVGKSQRLVSFWIQGKCQPQLNDLPKIAATLGVTIEEIVNCFQK